MKTTFNFILVSLLCVCALASEDDHDHQEEQANLTSSQIWGFGFLAGFGVSLIGFIAAIIVIVFKRCFSDDCFNILIKFLFGLGCGALIGDSMVHILAQGFSNTKVNNQIGALICLCSIAFFLILERIFQSCGVSHTHWQEIKPIQNQQKNNKIQNEGKAQMNQEDLEGNANKINKSTSNIINQDTEGKEENDEQNQGCCKRFQGKGSAGYLNLISSLIHNWLDGLAIGVAFATGHSADAIPVFVAIVAHEIPREIGDVAILMQNKFSEMQTLVCNGTINLISIVGVLIGLGVSSFDDATKAYILIFVAGNFIYIAADIWRHLLKNRGDYAFWKNLLEFSGFSLGVGIMYLLLLLQSDHDH